MGAPYTIEIPVGKRLGFSIEGNGQGGDGDGTSVVSVLDPLLVDTVRVGDVVRSIEGNDEKV